MRHVIAPNGSCRTGHLGGALIGQFAKHGAKDIGTLMAAFSARFRCRHLVGPTFALGRTLDGSKQPGLDDSSGDGGASRPFRSSQNL
jgi:hypothetical protein